jgi:hypothetical protein
MDSRIHGTTNEMDPLIGEDCRPLSWYHYENEKGSIDHVRLAASLYSCFKKQ